MSFITEAEPCSSNHSALVLGGNEACCDHFSHMAFIWFSALGERILGPQLLSLFYRTSGSLRSPSEFDCHVSFHLQGVCCGDVSEKGRYVTPVASCETEPTGSLWRGWCPRALAVSMQLFCQTGQKRGNRVVRKRQLPVGLSGLCVGPLNRGLKCTLALNTAWRQFQIPNCCEPQLKKRNKTTIYIYIKCNYCNYYFACFAQGTPPSPPSTRTNSSPEREGWVANPN